MRNLRNLDKWRRRDLERAHFGCEGDETCGLFIFKDHRTKNALRIVASSGEGWDHVSVSLPHRCPTWEEMERVKRLFFAPEDVAFQLHVPIADHISVHPFCLHIWRPQDGTIPMPPAWMVA